MRREDDIERPLLLITRLPQQKEGQTRRERLQRQREEVLKLLEKIADTPRLQYEESGKPILANDPKRPLSISHSPRHALVGIAPYGYAIGVDVEEQALKAQQLAKRYCNDEEKVLLQQHRLPVVVLWSAKEAVYKMCSEKISGFGKAIILEEIQKAKLTMRIHTEEAEEQRISVHIIQVTDPTITYAIYPERDEPAHVAWQDRSE